MNEWPNEWQWLQFDRIYWMKTIINGKDGKCRTMTAFVVLKRLFDGAEADVMQLPDNSRKLWNFEAMGCNDGAVWILQRLRLPHCTVVIMRSSRWGSCRWAAYAPSQLCIVKSATSVCETAHPLLILNSLIAL